MTSRLPSRALTNAIWDPPSPLQAGAPHMVAVKQARTIVRITACREFSFFMELKFLGQAGAARVGGAREARRLSVGAVLDGQGVGVAEAPGEA